MTLFFGLIDVLLSTILLFDTLGLAYQFRIKNTCNEKDYLRVCLSWILFLTISNLFVCEKKGLLGTIIRLAIIFSKLYVVLPILGGTLVLYKYFIEDRHAQMWFEAIKSKICKNCPAPKSDSTPSSSRFTSESNIKGETASE